MSVSTDEDVTAGPASFSASVRVADPRWEACSPVAIVEMVMTAIAASSAAPPANAACDVLFADDATLADLNARFRGKDGPTNVLAFPAPPSDAANAFLGDVAVALETAGREAAERAIALTDHATHLVLHGVLHLLGYDHERDDERDRMERAEVQILAGLGIADPYLAR